ncbi:hypothetical protein JOF48_002577 [Arthrobacter stackebrandtii]|uniref:Uncharacterized protein n=1 Tax=Arthrobacter stackebrandtii TaxID=272161 RepID=A0ABS4YYC3_9MICC|nr:hypothetical protein [Arthrobacter stackebrandtii]MBP2413778.1 hypothetical protein [Arthrobacter stackebrandtii]PYH00364.1 hypothetical protein CVV67_09615 [Arthrobacter stackebrandtii]
MSNENKEPNRADYNPVEVGRDTWEVPGSNVLHRSKQEADKAAEKAYSRALEEWRREENRLSGNRSYADTMAFEAMTPQQQATEAIRASKAGALTEGVTEEEWNSSPEIRALYSKSEKTGAELYAEWKANGSSSRKGMPQGNH